MALRLGGILFATRVALLLGALFAAAVTCVFAFAPGSVDAIGRALVERYERRFAERLERATAALGEDPTRGIALLEGLASDLSDVRKQDRLDPVRRACLRALVEAAAAREDWALALGHAEAWAAMDPRDLDALRWRGVALCRSEGREDEGLDELFHLNRRFPSLEPAADALARELLARGRAEEALPVALRAHEPIDPRARIPWRVYRDLGAGYDTSEEVRPRFDGGRVQLDFDLVENQRALRIDPPPGCRLLLRDPVLAAPVDRGPRLAVDRLSPRLHHMTRTSLGVYETTGGPDPYLEIVVPEGVKVSGRLPVEFSAAAGRPLSDFLAEVLRSPRSIALGDALRESSRGGDLERFAKLRRQAAAWSPWRVIRDGRVEERMARIGEGGATRPGETPFRLDLELEGPGEVELRPPSIFGVSYRIEGVRLVARDGSARSVSQEAVRARGFAEDSGAWRFVEDDAAFVVEAPEGTRTVELRGGLR